MGYYSIHPNVGGTFNTVNDIHDHKKHPVTFRFRTQYSGSTTTPLKVPRTITSNFMLEEA
jgi:hypothetical protein